MESTEALNVDSIIERLHCGRAVPERAPVVSEKEMRALCQRCSKLLLSEPALLQVEPPVTICGDIHGQFGDLLRWFNCNGRPGRTSYLFLGDYVDRGSQSLEVFSLLMAYRIKFPECFKILRGNHECANMNRKYGFYDECCKRASITLWKCFTETFNCLPAAAIVGDSIFCCHGGLSPHLRNLKQICRIRRPTPVPHGGLLCDLLWADPLRDSRGWKKNTARGVSYTYGADVVCNFLRKHDMDLVCRAHQVVKDGYEFFADRHLVTIFSAPNYCGRYKNTAAVMLVDEELTCSFRTLRPGPTRSTCPPRVSSSSTTVYDVS